MALMHWRRENGGRDPFTGLQDEMNHLMETFRRGFGLVRGEGVRFVPAVDIQEESDTIVVSVEVPGLSQEDVQLTLEENALVLSGEKRTERSETKGGVFRSERSFGVFRRVIALPAEVDPEQIEAKMANGVLDIRLQKVGPTPERTRTIEIN